MVSVHDASASHHSAVPGTRALCRCAVAIPAMLLVCTPCCAHILVDPLQYPLGPFPAVIARECWYYVLPGLVAAAVEILLLKAVLRETAWFGCLWRGLLLYASARGVETVVLLLPGFTRIGPYLPQVLISVGILLVSGLAARALLAKAICRQTPLPWCRALLVGVVTELGGYVPYAAFSFVDMVLLRKI